MGTKSAKVVTELLPHQQRVVDRMQLEDQPGLLVAHGLGSGKTLTSIAAQDALKQKATVVLPAALQANYAKERDKHLSGKRNAVDMTTLQAAARRGEVPDNPMLIVDEAHRLRAAGGAGLQAVKSNNATKRMLLTATPFYNAPNDIAPLINVVAGNKLLPEDKNDFEAKYVRERALLPGLWGRVMRGETAGSKRELNPVNAPGLRDVLHKYVDYHPSSVEGFPTVTREDVKVPMTRSQLKVYDTMLRQAPPWVAAKIRSGLPPSKRESQDLNAFMSAVRQVSNTTAGFQPGTAEQPKIQKAFENLQRTLNENDKAKAIVYSNYLESGINPYKAMLQKANIPHGEFSGDISKKERDAMVNDYNAGKIRALLLSSAGGEGLDLKGTRLIQTLDPHWNIEKIRQVEGRGVRYGSHADLPEKDRNVLIQRYLATRPPSGVMERLGLSTPGGGSDEYLASMSADKERLHEQFRRLLPGYEKKAAAGQVFEAGGNKYDVGKLWEVSKKLPTERLAVEDTDYMQAKSWTGGKSPEEVLSSRDDSHGHMTRINKANLRYPVLVAPNQGMIDGMHRVAKAHKQEKDTVPMRRFTSWEQMQPALLKKAAADTLYHGSNLRIKELQPRGEHGDPRVKPAVFASPSRTFALAYTGKHWGDRDIEQSTGKDMTLREMRPGALQEIYGGQKGYLHNLPPDTFQALKGRRTAKEVVSYSPVVPDKIEIVHDVLKTLQNTPGVHLVPYDPTTPQTHAAIVRQIKRMKELGPEGGKEYKKWWFEVAPPEMKKMFNAEERRAGLEKTAAKPKGYYKGLPSDPESVKYKVNFQGIALNIERPKGFIMVGRDAKGHDWARRYQYDYGHIPKTLGGDGDGLDVFVGPDKNAKDAYWVVQRKEDGSFDEYKAFVGFTSRAAAIAAYAAHVPRKYYKGMITIKVEMMKAMLGVEPFVKMAKPKWQRMEEAGLEISDLAKMHFKLPHYPAIRTPSHLADHEADVARRWSGRHAPKPGEVAIPAEWTGERVHDAARPFTYSFRGNQVGKDEAVAFASRHPDVAASYAAGKAVGVSSGFGNAATSSKRMLAFKDAPHSGEAPADLWQKPTKYTRSLDTFTGGPHGALHDSEERAWRLGPGTAGRQTPLSAHPAVANYEANAARRNATYEHIMDATKLPEPVGEYAVRPSRIGKQPAYALRTVRGLPAEEVLKT